MGRKNSSRIGEKARGMTHGWARGNGGKGRRMKATRRGRMSSVRRGKVGRYRVVQERNRFRGEMRSRELSAYLSKLLRKPRSKTCSNCVTSRVPRTNSAKEMRSRGLTGNRWAFRRDNSGRLKNYFFLRRVKNRR